MFLVTRLLSDNGILLPSSRIYGEVEIKKMEILFLKEKDGLEKSIESFKEKYLKITAQVISVFVEAKTYKSADEKAEKIFKKILDLYDGLNKIGISNNKLRESGIIKNFETKEIYFRENNKINYSTAYKMKNSYIEPLDNPQRYLYYAKDNKLKEEYFKFLHWMRLIKDEENNHMKFLKYWFAFEGIIKVNSTDQIISKLSGLAGFLEGFVGRKLKEEERKKIKNKLEKDGYKENKNKTFEILNDFKKLRDKTVHESLETFEVNEYYKEPLALFRHISNSLQYFLEEALDAEILDKKEFWEYFHILYSDYVEKREFKLPFGDFFYLSEGIKYSKM